MLLLRINVGSTQVDLFGAGIVSPVKGCRRSPGKRAGDQAEEKIDVMLQGLPDAIDDWIKMIESLFSQIELGEQAFLTIQPAEGLGQYQSEIVSGKIDLLGNGTSDMKRGSMGIRLELVRVNYWEGEEIDVPLSNPHGTNITTGLVVDNQYHVASGKYNYALVNGSAIDGEIPSPATIKIKNNDPTYGYSLGKILVGQEAAYNLQPGDTWLEGALGDSGLMYGAVVDSGASGGQYGVVQWTGTIGIEIIRFVMQEDVAARFAGKLIRPVLRMFNTITTDDYWIRIVVKQGDAVEKTRWQKIETYKKLQVLPAVHIPPKDLRSAEMSDVRICIEMQRNVSGGHTFTIDDIDLMPIDGFREYAGLGTNGLMVGETLFDEPVLDLMYSTDATFSTRSLTHRAIGKGIWMVPGLDQAFWMKFDRPNGDSYPNQFIYLSMSYRPRRINL